MAKRMKKVRSNGPIYVVGFLWLFYALTFPLYRILDFAIAFLISIVGGIVAAIFWPEREVIVEVPEQEENPSPAPTGILEADEILAQGKGYLKTLGELEYGIRSPEVGKKVRDMREVSEKIYQFLREHPACAKDIRMFNSYYMPTTIETLGTYRELEKESGNYQGENVTRTMGKIDHALTTFTEAYRNLLDDLYQDKAMDVSANITVLQNLMEREGLMNDSQSILKAELKKEDETT